MKPYVHGQLIFDKDAKSTNKEGQGLQKMVLGKLYSMCKRMKLNPYFTPYAKSI
jgi:hypothetical protein